MLLYATVQGQKGILKLFAARLNEESPPAWGCLHQRLGGPPRREECLNSIQGTCSSPVPLRGKNWISSICCCSFVKCMNILRKITVPIYWWKRHHWFIGVRTTCSQVLQQVTLSLGCPFSFVLVPGCSLNCCETHRDHFKSGIHSQFHMYWTFSPLDPCSKVQSKKFLPWNEAENWWFPINSTHNELLLSNRR